MNKRMHKAHVEELVKIVQYNKVTAPSPIMKCLKSEKITIKGDCHVPHPYIFISSLTCH